MNENVRDGFLVALIALLIVVGALIVADLATHHIGALTLITMGIIIIVSIQSIAWYRLRQAEIESETQIAMAQYNPINQRSKAIPFNSIHAKVKADGVVQLTQNLALDKQDLIELPQLL